MPRAFSSLSGEFSGHCERQAGFAIARQRNGTLAWANLH